MYVANGILLLNTPLDWYLVLERAFEAFKTGGLEHVCITNDSCIFNKLFQNELQIIPSTIPFIP